MTTTPVIMICHHHDRVVSTWGILFMGKHMVHGGGGLGNNSYCDFEGMNRTIEGGVVVVVVCVYVCGTYRGKVLEGGKVLRSRLSA